MDEPILLGSCRNPDEIYVLIGKVRYAYQLSSYWIDKVEARWKHSPFKAFNLIKKQGKLIGKENVEC